MFRYAAFSFLWILPLLAPAQEVTGSITGSVADSTGSLIANATVRLVSETTGAVRNAAADPEGNFGGLGQNVQLKASDGTIFTANVSYGYPAGENVVQINTVYIPPTPK